MRPFAVPRFFVQFDIVQATSTPNKGTMIRSFINNPISLSPMATVNYVIEKDNDTGGAKANFIVEVSAQNKNVRLIIQAIMIGANGENQGFAFAIDGYSLKQ